MTKLGGEAGRGGVWGDVAHRSACLTLGTVNHDFVNIDEAAEIHDASSPIK